MATELLFSELKTWLDAQPENTASTPYEIIIKKASKGAGRYYTKKITRYVNIVGMEMEAGETSIGQEAFLSCKKLTSINIPNGVTSIGSQAFQDCSNLTNAILPASLTKINFGAFGGCSSLRYIPIPFGVTTVGDSAFRNCSSAMNLDLPATLTSIGDWAFGYCTGLTIVNVYGPFNETLMQPESFKGTTSNLRLLVYPPYLSGWQSATLTNYGFASGVRAESLYTKWVRVA